MPMSGGFDASTVAPEQGGGKHPVGNGFDFTITNTVIEPTKDQQGGKFVVTMQTPAGQIKNNYNLWNQSDKAREISFKQLSALCHAVNIHKLDWQNDGAALRGGRGKVDIGLQDEPNPNGYVEVEKVYDINGNEPGKPAVNQQPQQQPNPGFGQPQQQAPQLQAQPQAWGNPNQPAPQAAPQPQGQPQQGWPQQGQAPAPQQQAPQGQPQWSQQPAGPAPGQGAPQAPWGT